MHLSPRRLAGILPVLAGACSLAGAIEPIPDTPGWRGFAVVGAGYADLKSNLLPGNSLVDIGNDLIRSIAAPPERDDTLFPVITGEINYTFANRWQGFFGTSLEDALTLDPVSKLGVRTERAGVGLFQAGVLVSGFTDAWEDPYAEGVARADTGREATGVRLQWDRVLGSAFELRLSFRDIAFDSERSGEGVVSVPCDAACRDLLRRDGHQTAVDVTYLFRLGARSNHLLRPAVRYVVDDRDGDSISGDAYRLQLTYAYVAPAFVFAGNVAFGEGSQDEPNPLFGVKTDPERFAVDASLLYRLPFGDGEWQAVATVFWGEEDSPVEFHDSELFMGTLGLMYRFGGGRCADGCIVYE